MEDEVLEGELADKRNDDGVDELILVSRDPKASPGLAVVAPLEPPSGFNEVDHTPVNRFSPPKISQLSKSFQQVFAAQRDRHFLGRSRNLRDLGKSESFDWSGSHRPWITPVDRF